MNAMARVRPLPRRGGAAHRAQATSPSLELRRLRSATRVSVIADGMSACPGRVGPGDGGDIRAPLRRISSIVYSRYAYQVRRTVMSVASRGRLPMASLRVRAFDALHAPTRRAARGGADVMGAGCHRRDAARRRGVRCRSGGVVRDGRVRSDGTTCAASLVREGGWVADYSALRRWRAPSRQARRELLRAQRACRIHRAARHAAPSRRKRTVVSITTTPR